MNKLDFSKADPKALEILAKASKAVDDFLKAHPKKLSNSQHNTLRLLLSDRAAALSKVIGSTVHTIF